MSFATALPILRGASIAFRPPRRVSVSRGASDALMIRQPGGYSGPWSPAETPYMVEPIDMLASRRHEAVCFVGPARTGKALDVETPIPTPEGWTTMGDLKVGDTILSPSGAPTDIVFVTEYQYERTCYRVTFSDGETIVADEDHRWGVERFYWKATNWRYEVKTTAELLNDLHYGERANGRKRFRYRIRNTAPIELPEKELRIDPYLLGVWLGDGTSAQAYVSSSKADAPHYEARFVAAGHKVSVVEDRENTVYLRVDMRERLTTHCQRGHEFSAVGRAKSGGCMECLRQGHHRRKYGKEMAPLGLFADTFQSRLQDLRLINNKHVPQAYLRASVRQRMELLRGLMDTDGSFDRRAGRVEFTTVSEALCEGFCELARSLGFKPSVAARKTTWEYKGDKKEGRAYRIAFPVPAGTQVFSLPRKAGQTKTATADVSYRQIVSIEPVVSRPVKCIQVSDRSHMFLAGRGMVPTHNTMGMLDGWVAHCVTNDPGDLLIVQMSQEKAREYSKTRIDRAIRNSPKLRDLMSTRGHDDNTHDKLFRHGMWLKIGWPSASQLSSSDYRYVALTDYDRMPDDIDGEGSAYQLGLKRTQTFLSRGMCMVESSPGRDIENASWRPATHHEAPPCTGIVGIYNRGDRRRWYWQCPDCSDYFEAAPGLSLFASLPPEAELLEMVREANLSQLAAQHARVVCPHCGSMIEQRWKPHLNRLETARWVADGQTVTSDGEVIGEVPESSIASYWLGGAAAAYQKWDSLISRYLQGLREFALSGSELTLKATINTDQGAPYLPRALVADKSTSIEDRLESIPRYIVPPAARFLVATADVQGGTRGRFVCEVRAFGVGLESWLIDRFSITTTERHGETAQVDPAGYPEDWDLLTDKLVRATYRTADGREMRVLRTAVDTGGEAGTTPNAYAWYRRLRKAGLSARVLLVKGGGTDNSAPMKKGTARTNEGRAMRDMPLWLVATDFYKDIVAASLRRTAPGNGYAHVGEWIRTACPGYFDELRAETRQANGKWKKTRARNEALDLWVYALAITEALGYGPKGRLSWDEPPEWALPQDAGNSEVIDAEERRAEREAFPNPTRAQPAPAAQHDDTDLFTPILFAR
jgi:phage terminase large subunit GpA-like protein